MTERFTETISTGIVTDNKTGIEYICEMRIDYDFLNLVNTVAEENEQLQKKNDNLVHMIARVQYRADSIKDENEKLKKILGFLRNDNATDILNVLNSQENQIWELKKENEQLKHECNYLQNRLDDFVNIQNENEQLKKELSEYKDFVLSDDKILCYTCLFCTHKGIYEVDCDVKGHVDVHGVCHSYTKKEVKE